MGQKAFIDAGPIVAYLIASDGHHDWAVKQFKCFDQFVTCEAVLAEACARLAYFRIDQSAVIDLLNSGSIVLDFSLSENAQRVGRLMKKYADRPMDLADACLVAMSERFEESIVVTCDPKDFKVYRRHEREAVPFVSPPKG